MYLIFGELANFDLHLGNETIFVPHFSPHGSGKSYQFLLDPGIKNVGSEVSPKQINIRSPLEETCMD